MVSLPALLAEAPHIPYKLQLSLESCDSLHHHPPHTHSFSDMEGRYGCRYEQVEWKHLSDILRPVSCGVYLSGLQWRFDLWPPAAIMSVGDQHGPCEHRSIGGHTRNCHSVIHVSIGAVAVRTRQVDTEASISRDRSCAVGLMRGRCVHLCSAWTPFIKRGSMSYIQSKPV